MNKSKALTSLFVLFVLVASAGCSEIDSRNIRTAGINADMEAGVDGSSRTEVEVRLTTDSTLFADQIDLSRGDRLFATINGVTQRLGRSGSRYRTTFNFDAGGMVLIVELDRDNDRNARDSRITIPDAFDILMPAANTVFEAAEEVTVVWDPPANGNTIELIYSGQCMNMQSNESEGFFRSFNISDSGMHSVVVENLLNSSDQRQNFDPMMACPTTVTLRRRSTGTIDREFDGGRFRALQERELVFIINP